MYEYQYTINHYNGLSTCTDIVTLVVGSPGILEFQVLATGTEMTYDKLVMLSIITGVHSIILHYQREIL